MSWIYSFIIASLVFSGEGNRIFQNPSNSSDSAVQQSIKPDETERFEQTYPLEANGRISISNINGSITIDTWDNPQVKLEVVKTADSREKLSDIEIKIDSKQNSFQVETDYSKIRRTGNDWNSRLQVEFTLTVPRNAVLDEIETVNGSVFISNTSNRVKASAVNGQIKASNLRGTVELSTVNGTVDADFAQLQTGGKISLDTVNGKVNLVLPSDVNATIKADTVNGSISNEFGLPVRKGKYVGKDLYGKIGSGDVQIKLDSVNGGLFVKRSKDGKNLNPATNLLPQKNNDDNDWETNENDNDSSAVRIPQPPVAPQITPPIAPQITPPIAPRPDFDEPISDAERRKQINEALKQAQKEMGKLTPEIRQQIEAELRKSRVDLNTKEMQAQIRAAKQKMNEVMVQMSNANWLAGSPVIENKTETFSIKNTPELKIQANNCSVSVRGWDKQEVRYSVTKIGRNSGQKPINVEAVQSGSDVTIKILNNKSDFFEDGRIRLEIFTPKKSNLKITANGEIRLEGISGDIDLSSEEGAINVRDAEGKMQLAATSGRIRVLGFDGEIAVRSIEGDINLEGNFQKLFAGSESGSMILTLNENTNANLTTNKNIINQRLKLTKQGENLWLIGKGGADFKLQTDNGEIFLRSSGAIKGLDD